MNQENAKKIIELLGGSENIANHTHCLTRLRFQIRDKGKIKEEELKDLSVVQGIINRNGEFQVVIGPKVEELYHEVEIICPLAEEEMKEDAEKENDEKKKNFLSQVLTYISSSLTTAIPAMMASGMVNAILAVATTFFGMDKTGGTYVLLSAVADTAFFFLPVLVAFSGARRLKTNEYLAAFLALVLLHPSVNNVEGLSLFGIRVQQVKYSSNIVPALLMVPCLAFLDRHCTSWIPANIVSTFKPVFLTLVIVPLSFFLLGPAGAWVGTVLANLCVLCADYGLIALPVMSFLHPILVMLGMHTLITPLIINEMSTFGFSYLFCKALAANFAIAGAAIGVGLKAKNKENKQNAISTGITALISVTEPAVYATLLKYKRAFITALIASGITGIFIGIFQIRAYAPVSLSLLTMTTFIGGGNITNFLLASLCALIAFVLAAVLTYLFGYTSEDDAA